jgi:replicative DNA helicase Mcm
MTELVLDKPQERFQSFLKSDKYRQRISQMAINGATSLILDFNDLLIVDSMLAEGLLERPEEFLEYGNNAAFDQLQIQDPEYAEKVREQGVKVRIRGVPFKTPLRKLSSDHIGKLALLEGIVIRATNVRPLVTSAIFRCSRCEQTIEVPQSGSFLASPSRCTNPTCRNTSNFELVEE